VRLEAVSKCSTGRIGVSHRPQRIGAPMNSGAVDRRSRTMLSSGPSSGPSPEPPARAFAVHGPIARDDLPGLYGRVCAFLAASGGGDVVCDVRGVAPDAVTVDALARLQLAAHRHGCRVWLRDASDELLDVVDLMGLSDVLPNGRPGS